MGGLGKRNRHFQKFEYDTIAKMLEKQREQANDCLIKVIDASDDPQITFPALEIKLHAYYTLEKPKTGAIADYTLLGAPFKEGGGIEFTTDQSLFLDPGTNELRGNVSDFSEKYTYAGGAQEFVLTNTPTKIIFISVNGQLLEDSLTQWNIDVPSKTITILDGMNIGDRITVHYQYFIEV